MRFPKIEVRDNRSEPRDRTEFWWVWVAANGKVRATSETYSGRREANRGASSAHDELGGFEHADLLLAES